MIKKILLLIFAIVTLQIVNAQAPQTLNYQGIARSANGDPIRYQTISVRISIIDSATGGKVAYQETRKITTNYVGLFSIVIGDVGATSFTGSMNAIDWPTGNKHIKLEIDPTGLTNYTIAGITKLQSVPYALYASKVAGLDLKMNITDTANMLKPYMKKFDTAAMLAPYLTIAAHNNIFTPNKNGVVPGPTVVSGKVLADNGQWVSLPVVPVTSVNAKSGAINLTTTEIVEGSNLYFTDERAKAALASQLAIIL